MTLTRIILGSILGSVYSGDEGCVAAYNTRAKCAYHGKKYSWCYHKDTWSFCKKEDGPAYTQTKAGEDCVELLGLPAKCGFYRRGSVNGQWCYTDTRGNWGQCDNYHLPSKTVDGEECADKCIYILRLEGGNALCHPVGNPGSLSACLIPDDPGYDTKRVVGSRKFNMTDADTHCKATFEPVNTWSVAGWLQEVNKWVDPDLKGLRSDFFCWNWKPTVPETKTKGKEDCVIWGGIPAECGFHGTTRKWCYVDSWKRWDYCWQDDEHSV